jgi:hypothetical protein
MAKEKIKWTNYDLQSISKKPKDQAMQTPLIIGTEIWCAELSPFLVHELLPDF